MQGRCPPPDDQHAAPDAIYAEVSPLCTCHSKITSPKTPENLRWQCLDKLCSSSCASPVYSLGTRVVLDFILTRWFAYIGDLWSILHYIYPTFHILHLVSHAAARGGPGDAARVDRGPRPRRRPGHAGERGAGVRAAAGRDHGGGHPGRLRQLRQRAAGVPRLRAAGRPAGGDCQLETGGDCKLWL
jgi:hypothetical protein